MVKYQIFLSYKCVFENNKSEYNYKRNNKKLSMLFVTTKYLFETFFKLKQIKIFLFFSFIKIHNL